MCSTVVMMCTSKNHKYAEQMLCDCECLRYVEHMHSASILFVPRSIC